MQCDVTGARNRPASSTAISCQEILAIDWSMFLEYYLRLQVDPFPDEICTQNDPPPFKNHNFDKYPLIAP